MMMYVDDDDDDFIDDDSDSGADDIKLHYETIVIYLPNSGIILVSA